MKYKIYLRFICFIRVTYTFFRKNITKENVVIGKLHHCERSGTFDDWNRPHFDDPNPCYSGGIKWLDEAPGTDVYQLCMALSKGETEYKDVSLTRSCIYSNLLLYHQNFVKTNYVQVRCPEGLVRLTGLRRNDDSNHPYPNRNLHLTGYCEGSREKGKFCITSMQDCCKPSCAWSGKGSPDQDFQKSTHVIKKDFRLVI